MPGAGDDAPRNNAAQSWVALLGRGREDADGIQDYCAYLGEALARRGIELRPWRLDWQRLGSRGALDRLREESQSWNGRWVLIQYTALAFSSRGFALRALSVLRILRRNGVRCAVVFHDPARQSGSRFRDRIRGSIQEWIIRRLFQLADIGVFPDSLTAVPWLPKNCTKAVSIPIGANIPELPHRRDFTRSENHGGKVVAVFCLSLDAVVSEELEDLFLAAKTARESGAKIRLIFLGRGTEEARVSISARFGALPIEVTILGLLEPECVADVLSAADAMLCVRGRLYPRRGSAVAGIACGLPILAYGGAAEGTPLAEAGVLLVPYRNAVALGQALARVVKDNALADELRCKSASAYKRYFSWDVIADSYEAALRDRD